MKIEWRSPEGQTYAIVSYSEAFLADIVTVERASFSTPWSEASLRQAGTMENSLFFTVISNEKAIGFGCILIAAGEGELVNIAVLPAYRKLGLGQKLLSVLLEQAEKNGVESVYLEVRQSNVPARRLYEKNGFRPIGIRKKYYRNPVEDAVQMQRCAVAHTC